MKKASLLYFLKDRRGPYRKIGLAVDVGRRINQLPDDIDRGASYVVECFKRASDVERSLHHLFSDFRIRKEHGGDGHTEWFAEDCFDAIRRFIEDNRSILGVGPFLPISDEPPDPSATETIKPRYTGNSVGQRKHRMSFGEYMEACRESLQEDDNREALRNTEEFFGRHALIKWPTEKWNEWGVVFDINPLNDTGSRLKLFYGPAGPILPYCFSTLLSVDSCVSVEGCHSGLVRINDGEWHIAMKSYGVAIQRILDSIPTADARPEGAPALPTFGELMDQFCAGSPVWG